MSDHSDRQLSSQELAQKAEEKRIVQEMFPFFVYALIPLAITIMIAWKFGPSM